MHMFDYVLSVLLVRFIRAQHRKGPIKQLLSVREWMRGWVISRIRFVNFF